MIEIEVPGSHRLRLSDLVLDYNGTLACDGKLLAGVPSRLVSLASDLRLTVVTADTFGRVQAEMTELPCEIVVLPAGDEDLAKTAFVESLGADTTVAIGNGRNDRGMLEAAALGLAVVQREGAASPTLAAADLVFIDILDALDSLLNPQRLAAGLRR